MFIAQKYRFTTFWSWKEALYLKLVEQINKDFRRNEDRFSNEYFAQWIKNSVTWKIYRLIQYKFAEYLNQFYISMSLKMKWKMDGSDLVILAEQVSF
jgi:hypothetical protein